MAKELLSGNIRKLKIKWQLEAKEVFKNGKFVQWSMLTLKKGLDITVVLHQNLNFLVINGGEKDNLFITMSI